MKTTTGKLGRPAGSVTVRFLVTVAALGYLAGTLDLGAVVGAVITIDGVTWALLVVAAVGDRILAVSRWLVLVRASGIELGLLAGARVFLVSAFVGGFLPSGGGDVARTWTLASRTGNAGYAVGVAAVDRWLGLAAVLTLGCLGLSLAPDHAVDRRVAVAVHVFLGVVLLAGLGSGYLRALGRKLLPSRLGGAIAALDVMLRRLRRNVAAVGWAIGLSFATQTLRIVLAWLIGVGMALNVPLSYYFVVMPIGIVLMLLPISIAGLGPAQGIIVWMLRPVGVPDELSFALSTLYVVVGMVTHVPGAVLFLRPRLLMS